MSPHNRPGRIHFLETGAGKELVLQFRGFDIDGRSLTFEIVDRPVTKAQDRAGDAPVAAERGRPRSQAPFVWEHDLNAALAKAKAAGRKVILDFETTWCGPCKSMDAQVNFVEQNTMARLEKVRATIEDTNPEMGAGERNFEPVGLT
jgi:hypothetical protein